MITYRQFVELWIKHVACKWWFGVLSIVIATANGVEFWIFYLRHAYMAAFCAGFGAVCGAFTYFVYCVCYRR